MPTYIATYDVEIIFEPTGSFMNVGFDYEFYAENDEEADEIADDYCQKDIYADIMSNISIVPAVENVEEER
jgi:hypothetical protein